VFLNDPESPALRTEFVYAVGFDGPQRQKLEAALQAACEDYLQAERKHTLWGWSEVKQLDVTVGAFPRELDQIERRFRSQVDRIAGSALQRSRARTELNRFGALFPYGRRQEVITIWTAGGLYYWRTNGDVLSVGRQLPREIARFWRQPGGTDEGAADGE
jgi:hypothetical protein